MVRFALDRARSALVVLHDATGTPVPVGAIATPVGSVERLSVGHDGQVYLRGLVESNRLVLSWGNATSCVAQFPLAALDPETGRIGPVRCE